MTQTRIPLFGTGIPQIVPFSVDPTFDDALQVLDLRQDATRDQGRLVTVWVNSSSLTPVVGSPKAASAYVQQGSGGSLLVGADAVFQSGAPIKLLDNYLLRGDVRLFLSAEPPDLATGDFVVAWGYYTIEGEAPRTAFELRPLQPSPNVIPATMGQPVGGITTAALVPPDAIPTPTDIVLHTVSDTNIDEIRLETYLLLLADPNYFSAILYFTGTPIAPPFVLGPGYISMTSPLLVPPALLATTSVVRRYFDGAPFLRAGELHARITPLDIAVPPNPPGPPAVYPPVIFSFMGSFTRN